MGALTRPLLILWLRAVQACDRLRLRALMRRHPGLSIDPGASPALAVATFNLYPGARVRIEAGVVTERRRDALRITVRSGGELVIGRDTWLRTDLGLVILNVYEGARMEVGRDGFLNGCQMSAKSGVTVGRHSWIGPGSRLWDSDQHDLDAERKECSEPIVVGDHVWIASDVTVLRGVEIGDHTVVGTRSLVTRALPPHSLAFGVPARVAGEIGDRSEVPV